jgi:eukaryotic-like serine/threonine-protein kinase
MPLAPGQIVNGKYRVVRLLGDGGMGSVYEAHHEVLGTRVALKLLHAELTRTGVAKRFLQEARASARIKSPHVVGVSDADQTTDGLAFIVLEYVEGRTLREMYEALDREHKRLGFNEALDFAMQMIEGVDAAHAAGIVHRDLKPDNVMVTQDKRGAPLLKLLDFGIAKVDEMPESGQALTRPGALLGTPEYMAPEQVYSANSADVRSDVFSLGVILFEMLSGRRPVLADDPQQIAVSYLTGAFTRLEDACPGVPPALATAVHRALAAQPRDRFASVAELRTAIEPFAPPPAPATTGRLSVPLLGPPPSTEQAPAARKLLPETHVYPQQSPAVTQDEEQGAITRSANLPRIPADSPPAVAMGGPERAPQPPPAPAKPAFAPDYPSAMAPASLGPQAPPSYGPAGTAIVPAIPPTFAPPSYATPEAAPEPTAPAPPAWSPPSMGAPLAAPGTVLPPQPQRRNVALWVGIAVAALLAVTGITLGSLYYLGWLDADPPPKTHKPPPVKPHPTQAPTHKGPSQLR